MGQPDMRMPIQYAFSYPERLRSDIAPLDFIGLSQLTFEKPDRERFPNLNLAYLAVESGGNMPCILNAANEVAVQLFLEERIGYRQMSHLIEETMQQASFVQSPSLDDYLQTDAEARAITMQLIH
jgi:1-deoxy-D-xylulose-5-phosphate reductoisomerase